MRRLVPSSIKVVLRWAVELAQRASAVRLLPVAATPGDGVAVVCIYRARNTPSVARLLGQVPNAAVRLWALDQQTADLRPWTVGTGVGTRLALLNRLTASLDSLPDQLVFSDDDFEFVVGDLGQLLGAGAALGFDLFQPAHTRRSYVPLPFARMQLRSFARETTFVEQGPLVVMSAAAQQTLLPLPEELGMGFGVELGWERTVREAGLRSGIIDAVAVRHDRPVGVNYDREQQRSQLRALLDAAGFDDIADAQEVLGRVSVRHAWAQLRENHR